MPVTAQFSAEEKSVGNDVQLLAAFIGQHVNGTVKFWDGLYGSVGFQLSACKKSLAPTAPQQSKLNWIKSHETETEFAVELLIGGPT